MTPRSGPAFPISFLSVLVALMAFVFLQDASYVAANGVLEYPLDDPYIHLAMAEQLRAGGYGVNAGEYAAASSSPLFSVLLLPLVGTSWHAWLPFFWNLVGLIVAAWLWGRILWQAGYGAGPLGLGLAVAGPIALNMVGVAYVGMEHALHVAASLAIVLGLLRFLDEGRLTRILILGVLLSPLLRFEGLALALMAALVVIIRGRVLPGLGLAMLAVLPVAAFAYALTMLGLDPLPSSVSAKLALPHDASMVDFIVAKVSSSLGERRVQALLGFLVVAAVLLFARPVRDAGRHWLVLAVAGAGVAHFLLGRFGWMDRYEIYILCTMAAGLLAAVAVPGGRRLVLLPIAPMVYAMTIYLPLVLGAYPSAGNAVHLQQAQMGRFAKEFLREPVAVNDLGHVAWQNPDYVLDLWGLASREALRLRLEDPHAGWADELTDAQDVRFAMVYDHWFSDEIGDDWVLLGQLHLNAPSYFLGGKVVNFYLTRPMDAAPYLEKLTAWSADLPDGATFEFTQLADAGS